LSKSKVLVALRDAESVEGLVVLACQVADGMKSELAALHVIELPLATPIEAESEALEHPGRGLLALAERVAREKCGKKISTQLVKARSVGEALTGIVKEEGYELLVMGYHPRGRLGEILLGSTVQHVARHAPCRVLVQISPEKP
jgi:nucleotide-binding universal stress UspA family protein